MEQTSKGRVVALFLSPRHGGRMQACDNVRAREDHGLEGDAHARTGGSRQVLLLEAETLAEFGVAPGELKENITTAGISLAGLRPGSRLELGEAVLEITMECAPCTFVDAVQPSLQEKIRGRRGLLARVIAAGRVRVGDAIEILNL